MLNKILSCLDRRAQVTKYFSFKMFTFDFQSKAFQAKNAEQKINPTR